MATFPTIWSIDLGKSSLKAIKLRRQSNNIEILAIDKIDYPIGNNGVDPVAQAREALEAFRTRNDVRDPIVVAHPGQGTFSRFIKVPAFEAKKLKEMVGYEASQQIPFPLDEVIWDYHIVSRDYMQGEEREVGIFAVRREAIDDYLLDFTSNGLSVEMLSIGYLGLINYILYDIAPQEPSIVLDIGATHSDLILVDGKKFWVRALPHSGNDINKAIMDKFKVSFQEAENLKVESSKHPQQAEKIFASVIKPKLKELVGEIHRSSGYYRSQAGDVKFQNLYLLGNGTKIIGIKKYLQEQLGLQVHRVQTIRHFRVSRDVDVKLLQSELPAFGTAFGCALQGVGAGNCRVDLVPQEERIHKDLRRKRWHAFYAAGIVFAAIGLAALFMNSSAKKADDLERSTRSYLAGIKKWEPEKPPGGLSVAELQRQDRELVQIGEARGLALEALQSLGTVLPGDNAKLVEKLGAVPDRTSLEATVKTEITEVNGSRVFIPWLKVNRVEWPEVAAEARSADKSEKKGPSVPAYKVAVFAAVVQQGDPQKSLELLQTLLVEPLRKKLKENKSLIDPKVEVSPEYKENLLHLYYTGVTERGDTGGAGPVDRPSRRGQEEVSQEAGPFFGTTVTWYLRTSEPKEEAPPPAAAEPEPDKDKKPQKRPGKK